MFVIENKDNKFDKDIHYFNYLFRFYYTGSYFLWAYLLLIVFGNIKINMFIALIGCMLYFYEYALDYR